MLKTLLLNGSPQAKAGNTEIFIREFLIGMVCPCEVRYIAQEDCRKLADYLYQFDCVIIFMPLYVHAMPGIVRMLIEQMKPACTPGKSLGFLIQSGYIGADQTRYLTPYLQVLSKLLNYEYLGTVVKSNSNATRIKPKFLNKSFFSQMRTLGHQYEINGCFDQKISDRLAAPKTLSLTQCRLAQLSYRLGLENIYWHRMMKKNNAFESRLNRPFQEQKENV